jgi:3-oxoacyl-[acyl-carrier protein] reductase
MTQPLDGKIALVTGSGQGLGRTHAVALAEKGADVIVHDILADAAEETMEMVRATGRAARLITTDIRDVEAFQEAIRGMGRIDILVNNAGVPGNRKPIEEIDVDLFDLMYNVHVRGAFFATQAVIGQMKERRAGKIVNISSIYAMGGSALASHYGSAKSAISGLTKCWAREFAPWRINVNAVAPGFVLTDSRRESVPPDVVRARSEAMPLGRLCEPIDIAHAVVWLAGPDTDMITGQVVSPNAGEFIVGY